MARTIILILLVISMLLIIPLDSYGVKSIIIGKGVYTKGLEEGKVAFYLIYENDTLKRAFFKFTHEGNWIGIKIDKWNQNGGMITNNNGDTAMIVLNDGKGELHIEEKDHREYKFRYSIIKKNL